MSNNGSKPGPSTVPNGKSRPLKSIPKTVDLLRSTEHAVSKGKGKGKAVMKGLDDLVKASSNLPGAVQVERFAEVRAVEILALQTAVRTAASQSNSRAFQSLPRHLRRRAASHNPRRVPKRLRKKAAAEIDPGDNTVRIHRKKARLRARGNLRGESRTTQLLKRQRDKRWLATHIFHAKRFHMINLWGCRLPLTPTLKSFRPSYRAARRKAILHDASYTGTIELEGPRDKILAVLAQITADGSVAGSKYETGSRAAQTNFYYPGSFPTGFIGPVEVIWQAIAGHQPDLRRLWLRLHPSIFDQVWSVLRQVAHCSSASPPSVPFTDSSNVSGALQIRDLRDDIESFEIMGPLAGRAIRRALRFCRSTPPQKRNIVEHLLKADPSECPEGAIVGFTVYDPRLSFPPSRLVDDTGEETGDVQRALAGILSTDTAISDLWDDNVRDKLSAPTFKKSDLDVRRHKLGLPGTRLRPIAQDDRIPFLMIKRTVKSLSEQSLAFHGYTLLFPQGWSMALLPSFIHSGVLMGGLAERRVQCREAGTPSFPEHYTSTCQAGSYWEFQQSRIDEARWLRKPPGKRPEYSSLGNRWPFRPDWTAIIFGESEKEERDINGSADIKPWLVSSSLIPILSKLVDTNDPASRLLRAINAFRMRRGFNALAADSANLMLSSGLCHVRIDMMGRGSPSDMAVICALGKEERSEWLRAQTEDEQEMRLFGSRDDGTSAIQRIGEIASTGSDVIGFVSTGNFSLSRGQGHALAIVTLSGYLALLKTAAGAEVRTDLAMVKVRNRDGIIYRLASLSLIG